MNPQEGGGQRESLHYYGRRRAFNRRIPPGRTDLPLYSHDLAVERIRAARAAIDASQSQIILTGRCEAFLVGHADPLRTCLARLVAYAQAGADCLDAPGLTEEEEIAAVVRAVAPKPVNVLVSGFKSNFSQAQLADLGVRRISSGRAWRLRRGAPSSAARDPNGWQLRKIAGGARFAELNQLFTEQKSNNNTRKPKCLLPPIMCSGLSRATTK